MPLIPQTKTRYRPPVVASKAKPVKPKKKPVAAPYGIRMAPRPSYNAQQQSILDAWKVVQPQIDAATSASLRSGEAGMGAIKGYTAELAKALGAYNPGEIYGRAQQSLAAISQGVQGDLTAGGQKLGSDLGAALAAINAPQETRAYAGGQAAMGAQSGAAQYGLGSADLEAVTKSRAAAENYSAQLPGIAGFAGLQSARAMELARQQALRDTVGDLAGQVPGLVQQRYGEIKSNQQNRAEFAYQQKKDAAKAKSDAIDREREDRQWAAAFGLDVTKAGNSAADQNADRVSRERTAAANRAATAANAAAGRAATARQKALDRKATKEADAATKQKTRTDAFYTARDNAFQAAAAAAGANVPKAKIREALWANYGQALLGRGFTRAQVTRMIENAIKAGLAAPKVSGAKDAPGPGGNYGGKGAGVANPNRGK